MRSLFGRGVRFAAQVLAKSCIEGATAPTNVAVLIDCVPMDQVPIEDLPKVDVEGLKADMRRGRPPTSDDVTILRDGTRLDTPAKIRAWLNDLVQEHRHRVQGVDR